MTYPENDDSRKVAGDQIRAFVERIERMEEEKRAIADDIKEIYAEAKGTGFDSKVLRKIVMIRKMDHNERMEQEALLDMYLSALGMQSSFDFAQTEQAEGEPEETGKPLSQSAIAAAKLAEAKLA